MGKKKRQEKPPGRLRLLKWLVFILLLVSLLAASSHVLVNHYEREIFHYAAAEIHRKSGGVYTVTCGYVDINLLTRSIYLKNLSIKASHGKAPIKSKFLVNARVSSIRLEGISLYDLVIKKTLKAGQLDLSMGAVSLNSAGTGEAVASLNGATGAMRGVKIPLTRRRAGVSIMSFKRGQATLSGPTYNTSDGFYTFQAQQINITQATSSVEFKGLKMIPRYDKSEFSRKKGYRSNRFHLETGRVVLGRIDFDDLFKNRRFHCERLLIETPSMEIYRDKNVAKRRKPKPKKFPQQRLRDAKFQLFLGLVQVTGGNLIYTERMPGKNRAGTMFFNDIKVDMTNVTNYPEKIEKGASLELKASLELMGAGSFNTMIKLPLADKRNSFVFSGTLGPMNMKLFNTMLIPASNGRIDRGKLDRLDFTASGSNTGINGEMRFRYRNLKLSLLKRTGSQKKRKFRSFLANMVIYENNPRRGKLRVGKISYKKEAPMTIFTYMWKSLLTGFKSSLGLSKAKKGR